MNLLTPRRALAAALLALAGAASAQVQVADAWVRGTVPAQKSTGLFARLTAPAGARLVQVRTPVAGQVELHEMAMEGDVMRMRQLDAIELPAGRAVSLEPGGLHVMLLDLKKPLARGDSVPLTLVVVGADGQRREVQASALVRGLDGAP